MNKNLLIRNINIVYQLYFDKNYITNIDLKYENCFEFYNS